MSGIQNLLTLPQEILDQIILEFGSVAGLYKKVFDLNQEEYRLTGSNSPRLKVIENELFDIEDKLEGFGVTDGRDITSDIAADFGEIIVNKRIQDLDKYLKQFGTDFETMRKWLKDNYNI